MRGALCRLGALLRRARFERDMDEEMRLHLELEIDERIRAGMSTREARRTALRDFGGIERMKEHARDVRGFRPFDTLHQDLRFGLRVIGRGPGFALLAILTLAVGIAAPTAVFSLANAVLFRPVPGVNAPEDRLLLLRFRAPHLDNEERGIAYPDFTDLRAMDMPAVRELVGWQGGSFQVAVPGAATGLLRGVAVAGDLFGALGVRPAAGRLFGAGETEPGRAEPVVVLSERGSRELFGEDDAAGRTLLVNGVPLTVIGVAGGGFRGVDRTGDADLWIPYGLYPRVRHFGEDYLQRRGPSHMGDYLVRLSEAATAEAARAQLGLAADRLAEAHPDLTGYLADYRPTLYPEIGVRPLFADRVRTTVRILLAAVALVLLVACANVANLLIFRGVRRQGESAVRQAMGASRGRLFRQHLTESGLLAAGGVVLGLALAAGATRLLEGAPVSRVVAPEALPMDLRVLGFAVAAGAASLLLAGLIPAVVVHRLDLVGYLKEAAPTDTGRKARLRATLTIAQLGLSLALLVGALLLARTLDNLQRVELGFRPDGLVRAMVNPEPQGYEVEAVVRFKRELLREAGALPLADDVALAYSGPFRVVMWLDLRPDGAATDEWMANGYGDFVTPGYFRTLGVPMVRGRTFTAGELDASWSGPSGVAVLNQTLARRLFGDEDPLGRTVVQRGYRENVSMRVVGVVGDSRARDLEGPIEGVLYRPLGESVQSFVSVLVRTTAPPEAAVAAIRAAVDRLDPALPFYAAGSLSDAIRELTAEQRLMARLMSVLALLAALLAAVGLYGVVAYSVAERTREIGIRLALGAGGARVVRMVVRQALVLAALGVTVGIGFAYVLARMLESRLHGVAPLDPVTWAVAAGAFAVVALVAAAGPARLAVGVEPVRALKS